MELKTRQAQEALKIVVAVQLSHRGHLKQGLHLWQKKNSQFSKQVQPENRSDAEDTSAENPLVQEKKY